MVFGYKCKSIVVWGIPKVHVSCNDKFVENKRQVVPKNNDETVLWCWMFNTWFQAKISKSRHGDNSSSKIVQRVKDWTLARNNRSIKRYLHLYFILSVHFGYRLIDFHVIYVKGTPLLLKIYKHG